MKRVFYKNLVKGEIYYIEAISKFNKMSGKKIGIFDDFEYPFGSHIPFAKFSQLRDLPNAAMYILNCNCQQSISAYYQALLEWYTDNADRLDRKSVV